MWELALIAAAGAAGFLGSQATNRANVGIARETNAFNAEEAAINRQWQEVQNQKAMDFSQYNADTAYRRGVADLRAAGLNPVLAARTPAPAPSGVSSAGSAASGVKAEVQNALGAGVSSAMQAAQTIGGLEQMAANTEKIKAETVTERFRPEQIQALTQLAQNQSLTEEERRMVEQMRINLVRAQTGAASAQAGLFGEQTRGHRLENNRFENYGPRGTVPNAAASLEAALNRAYRFLLPPTGSSARPSAVQPRAGGMPAVDPMGNPY